MRNRLTAYFISVTLGSCLISTPIMYYTQSVTIGFVIGFGLSIIFLTLGQALMDRYK
jgi:uncharacterized membrane protein